jgi:23S rRNA-/tRNA-specific pseudouridylate synthase
MVTFFNVITCPFSKTISCNKPDLNILFNNEDIAIFVKMTLTLVQGQGEEIGHNLLHHLLRFVC